MLIKTKAWYLSKTLWTNVVGAVVLLLDYLGTIGVDEAWVASALVLANLILRFLTDKPLSLSGLNKEIATPTYRK